MSLAIQSALVRIWSTDDQVTGAGFLVSERYVLTCAHVIRDAAGKSDTNKKPSETIFLDFPYAKSQKLRARVVHWVPQQNDNRSGDIAGLELLDPLPPSTKPVRIVDTEGKNLQNQVQVRGFPEVFYENETTLESFFIAYDEGVGIEGVLRGITSYGRLQLEITAQTGYTIEPGFSGAPIWDLTEEAVVGMVNVKDPNSKTRTGFGASIGEILTSWPNLRSIAHIRDDRADYLFSLRQALQVGKPQLFTELNDYVEIPVEFADSPHSEPSERRYYNSIFDIFNSPHRFMLIGEPGSGKSATMQKLVLTEIEQCQKDADAPLPIYVNLWQWQEDEFTTFLENLVKRNPALQNLSREKKGDFWQYTKLFLDGLDELKTAQVRSLKQWVRDINPNYPVLISCRAIDFVGLRQFELPVVHLRPLNEHVIVTFCQRRLASNEKANQFLSHVLPQGYIKSGEQSDISQLTENPFFLLLMLEQYALGQWETILNKWQLLNVTVNTIWTQDRIQELLDKRNLTRSFAQPSQLTSLLAQLVVKHVGETAIPLDDAVAYLPETLLAILEDTGFVLVNRTNYQGSHQGELRFRHQLFADYFAAQYLLNKQITVDYTSREWIQPLVILAGYSLTKRLEIQALLLQEIEKQMTSNHLQVIGEIGDEQALEYFLELSDLSDTEVDKRHEWLIAAAKIANRLPEEAPTRQRLFELLQEIMTLPTHSSGGFLFGDSQVNDAMAAAEAIAYIKSEESLQAFWDLVAQLAKKYENQPMAGQHLREEWFASYLTVMGRWIVPYLVKTAIFGEPEVASVASKALIALSPVPLYDTVSIMRHSPNPMVRENAFYIAARSRNLAYIPYLVEALDDPGIYQRGGLFTGFTWHFLADKAAIALGSFDTQGSREALQEYGYEINGVPTIELLLTRIIEGKIWDNVAGFGISKQMAEVIASQPNGLQYLLPAMGHSQYFSYQNPALKDPIATILVGRFERSHAEPSIYQQPPLNYYDISDQLTDYIHTSSDAPSRRWACIVLGKIGPLEAVKTFENILLNSEASQLHAAAVCGLGYLITRHNPTEMNISATVELMLSALRTSAIEPYGGIGLGLSQLALKYPESQTKIVKHLTQSATLPMLGVAGVALDALETVYHDLPSEVTSQFEQAKKVLSQSPSYAMKQAVTLSEENGRAELYASFSLTDNDYSDLATHYEQVTSLKANIGNSKLSHISEEEWVALGCGDMQLYHQLAIARIVLEEWDAAFDAFERSYEAFRQQPKLTQHQNLMLLRSIIEMGNIQFRFLGNPQRAIPIYEEALKFARELDREHQRPTPLVALGGMQRLINYYVHEGYFEKALSTGQQILEICAPIESRDRMLGEILFVMQEASLELGLGLETALGYLESADKCFWYSDHFYIKAKLLTKRALFIDQLSRTDSLNDIKRHLELAQEFAIHIGDAFLLSEVKFGLANQVFRYTDPFRAEALFQEALHGLENTDSPHIPLQQVVIWEHLGLLYLEQKEYAKTDYYLKKALRHAEQHELTLPYYSIFTHYGKLLAASGEHEAAINLLTQLMQEQLARGIPPNHTAEILHELDTPANCELPFTLARKIAQETIHILVNNNEKDGLRRWLYMIIEKLPGNEIIHDLEYIKAILSLIDGEEPAISENNPYKPYFQQVLQAISDQSSDFLNHIFSYVVSVLSDKQADRKLVQEQLWMLGFQARLSKNSYLENTLRGLYEYACGLTYEKAGDLPDIQPRTLEVILQLEEVVG